jgi:hypothetical protein
VTDAVWAEASGNYFYGPNTFQTITVNKITNQFSVLKKGFIVLMLGTTAHESCSDNMKKTHVLKSAVCLQTSPMR